MSFSDPIPEYEYLHDDLLFDGGGRSGASGARWALPAAADASYEPPSANARPARPVARRGGAAAMITALALAFKEVFEPEKGNELVIQVEAGEGFDPQPVEFVMVPGNPPASRVIVRRWLMR